MCASASRVKLYHLFSNSNLLLELLSGRDDWWTVLNEENADILCYDICNFSLTKMIVTIAIQRSGNKTASIALYDVSFTDVGDYGRLAREIYMGSNDPMRPCAFSLVAEGYGQLLDEPLVLFIFGSQNDTVGKEIVRNVDLKVNSLSVTVLPRSIEDVLCFMSKKWSCRNSNLEMKRAVPSKSSKKVNDVNAPSKDTLRFKFVAVYPRLILLADETDPYSRALVLRGLAVGNMSLTRDASTIMHTFGQVDLRSTTSLSGHVKELETYVHNNVDKLIGPNRVESDDTSVGVALVEPVTVTLEVRIESRSRFPTTRFVSIDIDPVAILLSFGDLNLIDAIRRRSFRKQKEKSKTKALDVGTQNHVQSPAASDQVCSPQFSNSSDYSQCEEMQMVFDVAILTKKLGIHLRKSGSSIMVESSQYNDRIEEGDILLSVNGHSVERMPLSSVVEMFDTLSRPLTITLSRKNLTSEGDLRHQSSGIDDSSATMKNSLSLDEHTLHVSSSNSKDAEIGSSSPGVITPSRFDVRIHGMPFGLELTPGLGDTAVVNSIDYELFARCTQSSTSGSNTASVANMIASRQWPLPGAMLLAVDGILRSFEEISCLFKPHENSTSQDRTWTLSFVEADSVTTISNLEGKMSLVLTLIDDTVGRDMPVLRAGINDTSFIASRGLAIPTKSIVAHRPAILSLHPREASEEAESAVLTLELKVSSLNLDFNNAIVNQWEPLIEPHCLAATIEHQRGNLHAPGQISVVIRDQIDHAEHGPLDFICVNVSSRLMLQLNHLTA